MMNKLSMNGSARMKLLSTPALFVSFALVLTSLNSGAIATAADSAKTSPVTVIYAVPNTPPDIDPSSSAQFIESELFTNTMSRLVDYKSIKRSNGTFVMNTKIGYDNVDGSLAESWKVSDDRMTVDMKLRKGVTNYLGNSFSAKDVRYTVDRLLALKGTGTTYFGAIGIDKPEDVKVIDDYNIQFKLNFAAALFFKMMAIPHMGIVDSVEMAKHATTDDPWATTWAKSNNVGFGPYHLTSNKQGVELVLEADPNYWKGKAAVDTVIMREVPSSANRFALLKGGSVDVVSYLTPRERLSLKDDKNVAVQSFSPAQTHSILYMTTSKKPFDNPKVRQAICYALPYDDIVKSVGLGTARRQHGPLPANYEFYAPERNPYTQNIKKAKALLAKAGYPKGFSTSIGLSNDDPTVEQQAASVQNALSKIGIKVQLVKQPFATYTQNWLGLKYDMGMMYEGAFIPDYVYALNLWYRGPKTTNFLDFTDYFNPKVNAMLDKAKSTFDESERKKLATDLQVQIMEDAPMCYLVEPGVHLPARKNIGGINYWTYSAQHFDQWSKR